MCCGKCGTEEGDSGFKKKTHGALPVAKGEIPISKPLLTQHFPMLINVGFMTLPGEPKMEHSNVVESPLFI